MHLWMYTKEKQGDETTQSTLHVTELHFTDGDKRMGMNLVWGQVNSTSSQSFTHPSKWGKDKEKEFIQ